MTSSAAPRSMRVVHAFNAAGPQELSVSVGELVQAIAPDEAGWTKVRASRRGANGANQNMEGFVPTSYLKQESAPSAPPAGLRAAPPPPPSGASHTTTTTTAAARSVAAEHAECTICYGEMFEKPAGALMNSSDKRACRHFLHFDCAQNFASTAPRKTCPICRTPFASIKQVPDLDKDPRGWFSCVDADGNGRLSKAEVLEVLKALFAVDVKLLEKNVDSLWSRWDRDGNGEVDFSELCGPGGLLSYVRNHFARKRRAPPPALTLINREEFFTYWDEDGNGTLEEEEIVRAVVKTLRLDAAKVGMVREYLRNIWAIVDPDNSGEVDLKEFIGSDGLGEMLIANLSFV